MMSYVFFHAVEIVYVKCEFAPLVLYHYEDASTVVVVAAGFLAAKK